MIPKLIVYGLACVILGGALVAAADALVLTEREQLQAFSDSVTANLPETRIDAALRYTNPKIQSVDVIAPDGEQHFDRQNSGDLAAETRRVLAPLTDAHLRVVQESVELQGGQGRVALRARTSAGLVNVVFSLKRVEDRWVVHRLVVS